MGIRISMSLLLGIDNLEYDAKDKYLISDPRWVNSNDWHNKKIKFPEYEKDENGYPLKDDKEDFWLNLGVRGLYQMSHPDDSKSKNNDEFIAWEMVECDAEFGAGSVVGVKISQLPYADEVLYALAAIYPEFRLRGYRELPSIKLEEDDSMAAAFIKVLELGEEVDDKQYKNMIEYKRKLFKNKQNYLWFSQDIERWIEAAQYIFEQIGLTVKEEEFKLMLYWKWS